MSLQYTSAVLQRPHASEYLSEQNLLQVALRIINELFIMRLADKIARPKDLEYKQKQIDKFGAKMKMLHATLYQIRSQLSVINLHPTVKRSTSMPENATNFAQVDWKKYIKLIELRYNEVLIEGSFRYIRNICQLLGLRFLQSMQLVQIEEWADECLDIKQSDKCCC